MAVRRCGKCGSSWMSALTHCAFCGTEGVLEPEISREPLKVHAGSAPPPPEPPGDPRPGPALEEEEPGEDPKVEAAPVEEDSKVEKAALPESDLLTKPQALPGESGPVKSPPAAAAPAPAPAPAVAPPPRPPVVEPRARLPLILGILAVLACGAIYLAVRYEANRILSAVGLIASALFIPAGPLAWVIGQCTVDGFHAKGLRPPLGARVGRFLGLVGTFGASFGVAVVAALIAICRFTGRLPASFLGGS